MSCLITEFLWIFSYKLQGILWNSIDTLWHSMKLYRYFREPHGIPWNSTIIPGIPWTSKETPWNFMAFHGTPSLLHGTPWNSIAFHGTPWNSMAFHGTPWILHGTPWHSMELHGYSMDTPWKFRGIPWHSMEVFHTGSINSVAMLGFFGELIKIWNAYYLHHFVFHWCVFIRLDVRCMLDA